MKVVELVNELAKYDQDLEVVARDLEYGYTSVTPDRVFVGNVKWKGNGEDHPYGGEHAKDYEPSAISTKVLMIDRYGTGE